MNIASSPRSVASRAHESSTVDRLKGDFSPNSTLTGSPPVVLLRQDGPPANLGLACSSLPSSRDHCSTTIYEGLATRSAKRWGEGEYQTYKMLCKTESFTASLFFFFFFFETASFSVARSTRTKSFFIGLKIINACRKYRVLDIFFVLTYSSTYAVLDAPCRWVVKRSLAPD